MKKTTKPIWTSMGNEQKNVNILLICKSNDGEDKTSQREITPTILCLANRLGKDALSQVKKAFLTSLSYQNWER